MGWAVDPELSRKRRAILDSLAFARNLATSVELVTGEMEHASRTAVGDRPIGDIMVSRMAFSRGTTTEVLTELARAADAARSISVVKWVDDSSPK